VGLPPASDPIIDDHIIGAIAVIVLWLFHAGDHLGLGRPWTRRGLVRRWGWLR
jgi:thiosulfate dehydrogenase [quinone] large subunit